jgi:3-deoxy-D-manno-octulosonic-acid transferase
LNLKLAGPAPPVSENLLATLRPAIGRRKVVLAASTHPGEEPLIAQAVRAAAADALLIVAPRHPDRGPQVDAELKGLGFDMARRAAGEPLAARTTAYVADTLGELGTLIAVSDVVVMGGSFVEGIGGHNPLEPARHGAAIVTGPHAFNARDVYAEMFDEAAAIEAQDAAALTRHITGLLTYPMIARRTGEAALAYANRQGAALEAAMALLEPLLPA